MNLLTPSLLNELKILNETPRAFAFKDGMDFEKWKKDGRQKLADLLGMDKFVPCDPDFQLEYKEEKDEYTEYRFTVQSEPGYRFPCYLLVPNKKKKPGVMICLQGHGTGFHVSLGRPKFPVDEEKIKNGDRDFANRILKEGYAALAIEQRNFGEQGGSPKPNCHAASLVALMTGRTIIGCRVWDIMKAIDVLENQFADVVDVDNVNCMGNSGGGTATLYASALEDRIKAAIPSCAFCSFVKSLGEQNHCECNYIPHIAEYFDMAEIAALSAPKPLVIVSGETDGIFPISGSKSEFERAKKIYEASGSSRKLAFVAGEEGHRFYAEPAWKKFNEIKQL